MRKPQLREAIEDISFELLSTAINLTIGIASFGAIAFTGTKSPSSIFEAVEKVTNLKGVTKKSLKRALWQARNKGLIKRQQIKGKDYWVATEEGKKRLQAKLPIYQTTRPWDKRLYLITYDIAEKRHHQRTILRKMIEKLGARRFQHSVYLILWNPTEILKQFIEENDLTGSVIISDTGTDGSIGETDLDKLVWEVFKLEEINLRYQEFLVKAKGKTHKPLSLIFHYLSILKDDPQLPFELLGPTWFGEKAHQKFKQLSKILFKSAPAGAQRKRD